MAMSTRASVEAATRGKIDGNKRDRIELTPGQIALYAILIAYAIFSLLPFVFAILSSFKPEAEVLAQPPTLFPQHLTLQNYKDVLQSQEFPFPNYILNSLIYAVATAALNVVLGAMAGYAFGRMQFPGKNVLFAMTLAVLMIPPSLIMIPKFLVANSLGLVNNLGALIIPAAVTPTSVFLMTQFLKTLPRELEESAVIDGASRFRTFWQIIFPLIRPAMITVAIFQFQGAWNDFMWPLLVMADKDKYTLTVGLTFFKGVHFTQFGLLLAGAAINTAPLVVIFFIFQRYFMRGISTSGLAGR
ncbi:MAG TPA: carbohydrate ABC transporter permease [Ktedonobacterales bacterium]